VKILRDLGWTEAPVSVIDLPPEQEKALNIVLNNREAQSDWDVARLRTVLEELAAAPDARLSDTGFTPAHLELLRDQLEPLGAAQHEDEPEAVEVILKLTQDQFEMLRTQLDDLVDEHGLECHVRCR
jgi:ParB-like chromosome segregation protein Spo0J